MFRVVFYCEDKKLPTALIGLTGVAIGSPEVQPVVNAAKKNGKVVAAGSGETSDLFLKYAKQHKLTKFKATALREFSTSLGLATTSYQYLAAQLVKAGVLKKYGKGAKSSYMVVT